MKKIFTQFFLFVALLAATANLSAQKYNAGTWYSLYDAAERTLETSTWFKDKEIYNYTGVFAPSTGLLTFDTKMTKHYGVTNPDSYEISVNGTKVSVPAKQTSYLNRSVNVSTDATSISFVYIFTDYNSERTLSIANVKLPLAQHILLANNTTKDSKSFGNVAIDGAYAGHIVISDCIKSDTKEALEQLKKAGVKNLVMLTGDRHEVAEKIADDLSMTDYKAELLPADKVSELEGYLSKKSPRATVGFVGDGINDAPVLARADIGIAMGGLGSDVAIEAADVVVMNDHLSKIAQAIKIARQTITIARENIIFSIGIKVLVLILASLGLANMWLAIFADVGVTVLATLNAMRTMKLT